METENILYPSLFEEDFITRSLGSIVNQPDVALTELVANAWDAGASHVRIFIPDKKAEVLYIEDDGVGMNEDEFQNHWMKLRYNRLKNQGRYVVFPEGVTGKRTAFGRNGVGRHGLFCFADEYKVITSKDGKKLTFQVKANVEQNPIAATKENEEACDTHGTRLEVFVDRSLPNVDKIREIISARFLHDPQFEIEVNHFKLNLDELSGSVEPTEIDVEGTEIHLTAYFIDTTKSSRKSIFQGIAFWQSNRLVGEPNWSLGKNMILDGRTALAKRYTFIIKTDDMAELVKEDWSGFKKDDKVEKVYEAVERYVDECIDAVSTATIQTVTDNLDPAVKKSLQDVNPLVRKEVEEVIKEIVVSTPKVKQESVNLAVKTLVNVEKSKNGKALLEKLSNMKLDDLDGLNDLLDKWTVGDALEVLNEIDRRLAVIVAIRKLAGDNTTDELHVLHPMIAESRWLFGPEYESSEYIFNRQMRTAVSQVFGEDKFQRIDINEKKRPDLVIMPDSTIGVTGLEEIPEETSIVRVRHLLLIELKKGAFEIKRKEKDQAMGYIEDLVKSTALGGNCRVTGFVVGDKIADNLSNSYDVKENETILGTLHVVTYSQLVDTAERRMFGLRKVLADRYDDVPGMDLYNQVRLSL
ncbi:MAG: ATP-binding protein [Bacteroidales bacterium]|nr:ATP-binding protein [Bacteroidales bacterium]